MPLVGHIDVFTSEEISGWAWDADQPERPVAIEIVEQDRRLMTIEADQFREDLRDAKIGTGQYGFRVRDLHRVFPRARHPVQVRRVADAAELSGSPAAVVATGAAHLTLDPRLGGWVVCCGSRAWELDWPGVVLELGHFLPMSVREPDDDLPVVAGQASRALEADGLQLILPEATDAEPYRLRLAADTLPEFSILWTRGLLPGESWRRAEATLEVENVIGVRLDYTLPRRGEAADKLLSVGIGSEPDQVFTLRRGVRGSVEFRTASRDRHRLHLTTDPEPGNQRRMGFMLTGLDVIPGRA
jgi:hypothetical protein